MANKQRILQLTDLHLFASDCARHYGVDTNHRFRGLWAHLIERYGVDDIDLLVLSGDLAEDEQLATYQNLAQLLRDSPWPILALPGNHDNPELLYQTFCAAPFVQRPDYPIGSWRILSLNSHLVGSIAGHLSEKTLNQLDQQLNVDNAPTIIVIHHPVCPFGAEVDEILLKNKDDFFKVVDGHAQVEIVLSGHLHCAHEQVRHGVHYLLAPAVAYQHNDTDPPGALKTDLRIGGRWVELEGNRWRSYSHWFEGVDRRL